MQTHGKAKQQQILLIWRWNHTKKAIDAPIPEGLTPSAEIISGFFNLSGVISWPKSSVPKLIAKQPPALSHLQACVSLPLKVKCAAWSAVCTPTTRRTQASVATKAVNLAPVRTKKMGGSTAHFYVNQPPAPLPSVNYGFLTFSPYGICVSSYQKRSIFCAST